MPLSAKPKKRYKVKSRILEDIRSGKLMPGERLATVREMCSFFNVSTSVVQNALHELTDLGLVECQGVNGFYVKSVPSPSSPVPLSANKPSGIHLFAMHHSDLVWRRTYTGYAKIREEQIRHLLELAKKHPCFCFGFEQAEILRVYLRDNPQDHETLRKLYADKRLGLYGGLCISDLNMVGGESILRNLLSGRAIYRELFGQENEIACVNDAFGMCAQLPQILKLCGFDALIPEQRLNALPVDQSPNAPFLWMGLDSTRILAIPPTAIVSHQGYVFNLPLIREADFRITECIFLLTSLKENPAMVTYCTEEGLINEHLFPAIEQANRKCGNKIRFGLPESFVQELNPAELPTYCGEFNPEMSGCYTTRIELKQRIRRLENALFEEAALAACAGTGCDLSDAWHELILCQFHDAICGCHTDEAFTEIQKKLDFVEKKLSTPFPKGKKTFAIASFNNIRTPQLIVSDRAPAGLPCQKNDGKYFFIDSLPPCGIKHYTERKEPISTEKECGFRFRTKSYDVDFSTSSPKIINRNGPPVFKSGFGEVLIRYDGGSMWEEKIRSLYHGAEFQQEKVLRIVEGEVFFKVVTEGFFRPVPPPVGNTGNHWPGFKSLVFRKEYIFPKELDCFRLKLTLDFKGENTEISVRFPLNLAIPQTVETYEIPFGTTIRKPYYEVKYENASTLFTEDMEYLKKRFKTASGGWPALNWVNYSDNLYGLTCANTGTPGHQLVNGDIIVTLLRSPTLCLDGGLVPQSGTHDNMTHTFNFAFCAHSPAEMEKGYELGVLMNRPPRECDPSFAEGSRLEWNAPNIALSSLEKNKDGILVRFYETLGRETVMRASSRFGTEWKTTDVSGVETGPANPSALAFKPFEIRTFRIGPLKKPDSRICEKTKAR